MTRRRDVHFGFRHRLHAKRRRAGAINRSDGPTGRSHSVVRTKATAGCLT